MSARSAKPVAISLFSGVGGLDLGVERAGFKVRVAAEMDEQARTVYAGNFGKGSLSSVTDVVESDPAVLAGEAGIAAGELDLLFGGPPCQPFSKSGYWHLGDSRRLLDPRAGTLHAFLRIVGDLHPRAVLLENVPGLAYRKKDEALALVEAYFRQINAEHGTSYSPKVWLLNAADFGVPQKRERAFIIALRDDQPIHEPIATHGDGVDGLLPHVDAWSAIGDLDGRGSSDLKLTGKWAKLLPSIPEGENYLWHTPRGGGEPIFGWRTRYWSFLLKLARDKPSWTIQASPGPATGPFHWENRMLSIRELCRLQSFPDSFELGDVRRVAQRQLGNAVPPLLAQAVASSIADALGINGRSRGKLRPMQSVEVPASRRRLPKVAAEYRVLVGSPEDHPGTSLGPGATRRQAEDERQSS